MIVARARIWISMAAALTQFALDVATFVKSNYTNAARLEDVTIAFSHVRSLGPVTITHTESPYTFAMREIPAPIPTAPALPATR